MVGDVLAQEMLLAGRRSRHLIFRRIYAGWLILLLLVEYWIYLLQANVLGHQMFGSRVDSRATSEFAASFMEQLVWQQFVLMLLATPAFVAGAITDEKTRGTLQYLLASDLSSLDIVLGKLLGRVWQVVLLLLPAVPMLCFIGVFAGLNLGLILALIILTAAPLLAMGAAGLLASVWCRNTRDAVLSVYVGVLVVAGIFWATGIRPLLDPRYILEPAWGASGDWNLVAQRVFAAVAIWVALAAVCLALATWQLRPVYLRQLASESRPRQRRWWRARRGAVPDEPFRWKERQVEGIAPLAFFRGIPRYLGVTAVFLLTLVSSLAILYTNTTSSISLPDFLRLFIEFRFLEIAGLVGPVEAEFKAQANLAMMLASLLIGLRCSGAITGERERQTWEAVLLTPLPTADILRGKLYGIVSASYPYVLAYAVPALALSLLADWQSTMWTALLFGVTWLAMAFIGAAGLWCSARAKSSWRSLLLTTLVGYGGAFILFVLALPVAGILFVLIYLTLLLIDFSTSDRLQLSSGFASISGLYLAGCYLALIAGFAAVTGFFLRDANEYISTRERIRHWKDEPVPTRTRRRRRETVTIPEAQPVLEAEAPHVADGPA